MQLGQAARFLATFATALFGILLSQAAQVHTRVLVRVVDPSGASVPRAGVQIGTSPDSLGPTLLSDENGRLAATLGLGAYYVQASAVGFNHPIRKLELLPGLADTSLTIALDVSSYSGPAVIRSFTAAEPELPLTAPSSKDQPIRCSIDPYLLNTGTPVFSGTRELVRYGISASSLHMLDIAEHRFYLWVDNDSARDILTSSCLLVQRLAIWSDSQRNFLEPSKTKAPACSADIPVRIPGHTCNVVLELDLAHRYVLQPGLYMAAAHTERAPSMPANPRRLGLGFQILRSK
jgi:hypothetical protein